MSDFAKRVWSGEEATKRTCWRLFYCHSVGVTGERLAEFACRVTGRENAIIGAVVRLNIRHESTLLG
jgi:hypothetical protein